MKNFVAVLGISLLAVACGDAGQTSTVQSIGTSSGATSVNDVRLHGPYATKMEVHGLTQNEGAAIHVSIDRSTSKGCWASFAYNVRDLGSSTYLVEVEPLMHPMIVCSPGMERDIEEGVEFDIPASTHHYGTYAKVLVSGAMHTTNFQATVKGSDLKVEQYSDNVQAADSYMAYGNQAKAYKVLVGRKTIRGCYSSVSYVDHVVAPNRHYVEVRPMMVPAVMCAPSMMHDIEVGVEFTVKAADARSSLSLLVDRDLAGKTPEVKIVPVK